MRSFKQFSKEFYTKLKTPEGQRALRKEIKRQKKAGRHALPQTNENGNKHNSQTMQSSEGLPPIGPQGNAASLS